MKRLYIFLLAAAVCIGCSHDHSSDNNNSEPTGMIIHGNDLSGAPMAFAYGVAWDTVFSVEQNLTGGWDFRGYDWDYLWFLRHCAPNDCPAHEQFPTASRVREMTWSDMEDYAVYHYDRILSGGCYNLGSVFVEYGSVDIEPDSSLQMPLPLREGSKWTEAEADSYVISPGYVEYWSDSAFYHVDATGTVVTPFDSVTCLRLQIHYKFTEWYTGEPPETNNYWQYYWMDEHADWVVAVASSYSSDNPNVTYGSLVMRLPNQATLAGPNSRGRHSSLDNSPVHRKVPWASQRR